MMSREGHTDWRGSGMVHLLPKANCCPERSPRSSLWKGFRIYGTRAIGFQRRQEDDFSRGVGKMIWRWEMFVLWWV